jgi:hypothetical protein
LYLAEAIRVTKRGFRDFRALRGTLLTEFREELPRRYAWQGRSEVASRSTFESHGV